MFTCFFQTPGVIDVQKCHVSYSWASVQSLVVSSKGRQFFPMAAVVTTAGDRPVRFRPAGSATRGGSERTGGELHEGDEDVAGWPKSKGFSSPRLSCRN